VRISQSIDSGEFFRIPALVQLVEETRRRNGTLHVMGLIGTGGVHALDKHLLAAVELGRRFIGMEIDQGYIEAARLRLDAAQLKVATSA